eukprot:7426391-Ditylum_brightwellii.AAC.1
MVDLSSAMLKESLDTYVHLEEAEMHKLLAKKIACTKKDHDKASRHVKRKHHNKSELHRKRRHCLGNHHAGTHKKIFATTMGFITMMTQRSATIIKLAGSMFRPLT